jgi:2-methyl-3-hydroxypyridine 5-carboxylic acid dioxygenase
MHGHAEVAGAGFAGMTVATALAQRGWTVRVHEKDEQLRAFGAGIFLWENGLRVLKALGAYEAVMGGAHQGLVYETRHANRVIAQRAFSLERGTRMVTMTRQHLYEAMLAAAKRAGVEFRTGSEVVGATPDGVLTTHDGRAWKGDLVVGADGVKSRVRQAVQIRTERRPCADGIARVLAPRCTEELGPGTWDHVIDFWAPAEKPLRILYVPCNERDLYLAMMAPVDDLEASAIPVRPDVWVDAFPQLEAVIRRISSGGRYDAYETTAVSRWSVGRVAIVGDAAHAMTPTLGQGAGTAMMNALSLAVMVQQCSSIEEALLAWETNERPLTEHTQARSEQAARERAMASGTAWNDETLKTARHIPTGTEHLQWP